MNKNGIMLIFILTLILVVINLITRDVVTSATIFPELVTVIILTILWTKSMIDNPKTKAVS